MADETMGSPGGEGVNPYNSLTRADTFGIRPDLFLKLSEITPSRPELDELMRQQAENAQKAEEIASDISGVVTKADFSEYDSALQARLWGEQGEFNQITAEFQAKQGQIDALQNAQIDWLIQRQREWNASMTDMVTLSRAELPWESDLVRVRWSDAEGVVVEPVNQRRSHVVATVSDGDASRVRVDTLPTRSGAQSMVLPGPVGPMSQSGVVGLVVRGVPGVERRLTQAIPRQTPTTREWVRVAQITVPESATSAVASWRIRWGSTGYQDLLGVRVRVAGRTLLEQTTVSTGGVFFYGRDQLHTAGNVDVRPGDVLIFECKNESTYVDRRRIDSGEALLAVIQNA